MKNQVKMSTPFTSKEIVAICTKSLGYDKIRRTMDAAAAAEKANPRVIFKYGMTKEEYETHIEKTHPQSKEEALIKKISNLEQKIKLLKKQSLT